VVDNDLLGDVAEKLASKMRDKEENVI